MRFVIATLPDVKFRLGRDLRLVKSCALYGDEAVLFSPTYLGTEPLMDLSSRPLVHQLFYQALIAQDPGFVVGEKLTDRQREARTNAAKEESQRLFEKASVALRLMYEQDHEVSGRELQAIADEAELRSKHIERRWFQDEEVLRRAREISKAEKMGLAKIQNFHEAPSLYFSPTKLQTDVKEELSRSDSYGALDERFVEEFDDLSPGPTQKIKTIRVATAIFERLPGFSEATIEEIVDVRKELSPHLAGFRKAVIEISSQVESSPWDKDFAHEVEIGLHSRLYPAVEAIQEELRTNSYLGEILQRATKNPLLLPASSAFGLLLSEATHASALIGQVASSIVGAGLHAHDAYKARQEKKRKAEGNELFFYYRASGLLQRPVGRCGKPTGRKAH